MLIERALEDLSFEAIVWMFILFIDYCTYARFGNGNDLSHNERHLIKIVLKNFAVRMQCGTVGRKLYRPQKTWLFFQFLHMSWCMSNLP